MYNQGLPSFMVDDPYQGTGFNGASENGDRDAPQTHEQLIAQNSSLKTRVSELEVINELFRGRLSQLEQQEAAARRGQEVAGVEQTQLRTQLDASQESASQLQTQLDDSHRRENNLKRRLDELELELKAVKDALGGDLERPSKRSRTDEDAHLADQALAPAEEQSESQQELAAEQTEEPSTVDATMSEAPAAETPAAEETTNGTTEAAPEPLIEDAVADSSES